MGWADEPSESEEVSAKGRKLRTSFAATAQTVLFFNQSPDDQPLAQWMTKTPISYQLKLNHCLSLLEDSARWSLSSLGLEEESDASFPDKNFLLLDLERLRIEESPEDSDVITSGFHATCALCHDTCPSNTRLREGIIRLIWSYLIAKELTAEARELALCDRLQYLKQITRY